MFALLDANGSMYREQCFKQSSLSGRGFKSISRCSFNWGSCCFSCEPRSSTNWHCSRKKETIEFVRQRRRRTHKLHFKRLKKQLHQGSFIILDKYPSYSYMYTFFFFFFFVIKPRALIFMPSNRLTGMETGRIY